MTPSSHGCRWRRLVTAVLVLGTVLVAPAPAAPGSWELRVCLEPNNIPYSNRDLEGFDVRIAEILADELGAELVPVWIPQTRPLVRAALLREGDCDVLMGVTDGMSGILPTHAYYRSRYVFVSRADADLDVDAFDDPRLAGLRVGIEYHGLGTSPAAQALIDHGLVHTQVPFVRHDGDEHPLAAPVLAVAEGRVDVAILWGPVAGTFAPRSEVPLRVVPVRDDVVLPFTPMVYAVALGVRPHEYAFRDRLDLALAARWDEIGSVLEAHGVPLAPLPRPTAGASR